MSSRSDKDQKQKQLQEKCQSVLNSLLRDEDNKYCVDCDSKGPRWASWNIGVFLCIRCAGIHRNLGVHISKVKSVNLDAWTPEQVVSLQQMGNSRARAVYEANLPDNFRRPQNDSNLESFIRAKYEHKKYIAREWVPPTLPKVNWEKEIDEEMEKQKRKKKTNVERKQQPIVMANVEVPQLPKPKNPSPKLNRTSQITTTTTTVTTTTTTTTTNTGNIETKKDSDLLSLQNGDDNFSGFLSAPPTTTTNDKKNNDNDKSEEESFFNQTIPIEKEKVKLTKDSILALYSNTPNFNQYQTNPMNYSGNFQNFGGYPQTNYPNGLTQFGTNNPQWGQAATTQPPVINRQFVGVQQPPPQQQFQNNPNFGNFQNNTQFTVGNQFGQFPQQQQQQQIAFPQQQQQQVQPNPFFMNQNGLQQQFANLNLNNPNGANQTAPPPTLATNIWQ